ncbi:MAG TPA: ubiquinone-dependent pyruvate dehydrogenase [Dinghuibacter sp.]|jgi:pyruvate dehydrogenase (quinone)|uniref:ubiquinone-dependent pyruvate dehydrogenase n=1 Tax=Dinghuibacter sp. TaxID=2024697 RepID=UPI002C28B4D6|nr:ubiquinone-dependent pyruvate dehydrogenase [Dinghuibacter sp.]HTJ13851.1 ubiquinone-dependent pyruvate dehydrogenase [Dinghuibacter sp.]
MTIASSLVQHLVAAGVQRVHGVVGDSLNAIVEEIHKDGRLEWVHYRHEEAAAFAAGAEAQLTGRLAVCAGSCGPGNLHLINGLYDAHRSGAPLLAIAAHIPSGEIGTSYFQETNPAQLFQECSHYRETIGSARQMPRVLQMAMQHAIGLSGVGVVILSGDVAMESAGDGALNHPPLVAHPVIRPSDIELGQLASLISASTRITLLCGAGCAGAHDELIALAGKLLSPIVHALRGKEHVAYDNPFDVGMTGLIGFASGYRAVKDADLLLMLGTDFPYKDFYPEKATVIQVDRRPERLGRRCRVDLGLVGNVKDTISALLPLVAARTDRSFLDACLGRFASSTEKLLSRAGLSDGSGIHPEYLTHIVSSLAAPDAIFTCDVGEPTVWAARYVSMTRDRRLIGSFNHGSMASAMPQAIGAQLTYPGRQVVSLSGDGGFAMLMGDLLTIRQYKLPVKIVIFNNGTLGFVAMEMKVAGIQPFGTDLDNPDFAAMATAMGIKGIRVEKALDVAGAVQAALDHPGPALLDVVVNSAELVMPPTIKFEQAKGFGLYALKQLFDGEGTELWQTLRTNFLE